MQRLGAEFIRSRSGSAAREVRGQLAIEGLSAELWASSADDLTEGLIAAIAQSANVAKANVAVTRVGARGGGGASTVEFVVSADATTLDARNIMEQRERVRSRLQRASSPFMDVLKQSAAAASRARVRCSAPGAGAAPRDRVPLRRARERATLAPAAHVGSLVPRVSPTGRVSVLMVA